MIADDKDKIKWLEAQIALLHSNSWCTYGDVYGTECSSYLVQKWYRNQPRQQDLDSKTTVLWIPLQPSQKPHFSPALLNWCSGAPLQVLVICPAMKTMQCLMCAKSPAKEVRTFFATTTFGVCCTTLYYSLALFQNTEIGEEKKQEKTQS